MCTEAVPASAPGGRAGPSCSGWSATWPTWTRASLLLAEALAACLLGLEQADAVAAVAWARLLAAFDAQDGHQGDGQRSLRTWLVHMGRVTRAQAGQYLAIRALPGHHEPLLAGLRAGALTKSEARQLARWTRHIPAEFRGPAEEILVAAARRRGHPAGARRDLRGDPVPHRPVRPRRQRPRPGPGPVLRHHPGRRRAPARRPHPGMRRDGPGGPGCPGPPPQGAGDLRTRAQRHHDALAEATAPRGAVLYRSRSEQGWEELSLDLMAYLDLKGEGDNSMPGNRWPCPGVRGGAPGDPRDMAKAGLPESQSPVGAMLRPPERRL